jgi:hypothetical protein
MDLTNAGHHLPPDRPYWTPGARRLGIGSAVAMAAIGVLYVATIAIWLVVVATPREPIGDPFLAVMEVLTIVSAVALPGLVVALAHFTDRTHRAHGLIAAALGILAASLTMAVHFVQLTATRQLFHAGALPDYRLVWPSAILAAEYFAWDVLVGATMMFGSVALGSERGSVPARRTLRIGGILCLAGLVGPATGRMLLQNIAVAGYAILLPLGCALTARAFAAVPPSGTGAGIDT